MDIIEATQMKMTTNVAEGGAGCSSGSPGVGRGVFEQGMVIGLGSVVGVGRWEGRKRLGRVGCGACGLAPSVHHCPPPENNESTNRKCPVTSGIDDDKKGAHTVKDHESNEAKPCWTSNWTRGTILIRKSARDVHGKRSCKSEARKNNQQHNAGYHTADGQTTPHWNGR